MSGIVVVVVHADWCGHCKTLKPKFIEAQQAFQGLPIDVIDLDEKDPRVKMIRYVEGEKGRKLNEVTGFPTVMYGKVRNGVLEGPLKLLDVSSRSSVPEIAEEIISKLPAGSGVRSMRAGSRSMMRQPSQQMLASPPPMMMMAKPSSRRISGRAPSMMGPQASLHPLVAAMGSSGNYGHY
jgi:thiol-disulfide isomerase/thioredoxin